MTKIILITALASSFLGFNAKAGLSPFYKTYAKTDGDIEALYAYDDTKYGHYDEEAGLQRLRTNAVAAGAETEAEVNEYLTIAIEEMGRKYNLYKSLAN